MDHFDEMGRKSPSVVADIIQIGLRLPWWASLLSAAIIYLLLNHYAQIEIARATGPQDISGPILSSAIKTGASIGQYAVPALLLMGMFAGLINKGVRPKLRQGGYIGEFSPRPYANQDSEANDCPKCGSSMVLRTAKRGSKAGSQFWGCSAYPACRFTRDIRG